MSSGLLVRYVPAWFPGAKFKRQAIEWRAIDDRTRWLPFNMVKRKFVSVELINGFETLLKPTQAANQAMPRSFTLALLEANVTADGGRIDEDLMSGMAATLFGGMLHGQRAVSRGHC